MKKYRVFLKQETETKEITVESQNLEKALNKLLLENPGFTFDRAVILGGGEFGDKEDLSWIGKHCDHD